MTGQAQEEPVDFQEVMNTLFKLKEQFPGMTWQTNGVGSGMDVGYRGSSLIVWLPVGEENAKLIHDARKMFEPIGERSL